jgi:hypothetical protein
MAGGLPGSEQLDYRGQDPYRLEGVSAGTFTGGQTKDGTSYFDQTPVADQEQAQAIESTQQQQQQSFLGVEPAGAEAPSAGERSVGEEWVAPVAIGVGAVGAGGAAALAYDRHGKEEAPEVPEKSDLRNSDVVIDNAGAVESNRETTTPQHNTDSGIEASTASTSATSGAATGSTGLGGLEAEGARETGVIFPKVIRHNTAMSVSELHVPGEYPKRE